MASQKKSSKESIKKCVIIATRMLGILAIVLYTCVAISPNREKSQGDLLNIADKPETSFTYPENTVLYENRLYEGGEKSKEAGEKVSTSSQVEQLNNPINMRSVTASLDEHCNSSLKEENEEKYDVIDKAQETVDILRKRYKKKTDRIKEMDAAVSSAHDTFLEKDKKIANAKEKYDESMEAYSLASKKGDDICKKIKTHSTTHNNNLRIPIITDAEYEAEMNEILSLYKEVDGLRQDQGIKDNIYRSS